MVGVFYTGKKGDILTLGLSGAPVSQSLMAKHSLGLLQQKEDDAQDHSSGPGGGFGQEPKPPPPMQRKLPNEVP